LCCLEERLEEISSNPHLLHRSDDVALEIVGILGTEVSQVGMLGVAPHPLIRIQLRGVGREALNVIAGRRELARRTFVCAKTIPNQNESATKLAPKSADESNNIASADVV
jgi:hypothetical protein